jgi:dTDP-4-dehydrorhamnose reductase
MGPAQDFRFPDVLQYAPMATRLLITGAVGFLGRYLLHHAVSRDFIVAGTLHRTPATAIPKVGFHVCDLQQPERVKGLLDRVRPECIIHTACSDQGDGINAMLPAGGLLAMQAMERGIRFIHLSTDQVFDGMSPPYCEASSPNPINPYGRAKAETETLITAVNQQATIVRTSLLYDLRTADRQTAHLIHAANTGESYCLFTDEIRCPVWVENLAEALLELSTKDHAGVLHIGGPAPLNRWEFGTALLDHFGLPVPSNIRQGTIKESGLVRPPDLTLDSHRAYHLLSTPILSLGDARRRLSQI